MASVCDEPNGRKRIEFGPVGARKRIRLGKASEKQALAFKLRVEKLESARILGHPPDDETSRWVAALDDKMHGRLAATGLVKARTTLKTTLGGLLDAIFNTLSVKPGTKITYSQTRDALESYFGKHRVLDQISRLDADRWRKHFESRGLAQATISKRVKTARQFFRQAIQWDMLVKNPFDGVRAGSQKNRKRMHFVSRADSQKVLDACPDSQWRLLFALSRFGGLRCPSEHLALKWGDVNWEQGCIRVPSCKTEHYEGGDERMMPLFPELRPYLLQAFEKAEPGTEYVITRYRDTNANLRTQLHRIIRRAGLTPWPKPFHNLRSTRQTELQEHFPGHVVCAWLGNSEGVAEDHYLQVTDAHFARAVADDQSKQAAQKPAQQVAEAARSTSQTIGGANAKTPVLPGLSVPCEMMRNAGVTPTGLLLT
jgi:integrase